MIVYERVPRWKCNTNCIIAPLYRLDSERNNYNIFPYGVWTARRALSGFLRRKMPVRISRWIRPILTDSNPNVVTGSAETAATVML